MDSIIYILKWNIDFVKHNYTDTDKKKLYANLDTTNTRLYKIT